MNSIVFLLERFNFNYFNGFALKNRCRLQYVFTASVIGLTMKYSWNYYQYYYNVAIENAIEDVKSSKESNFFDKYKEKLDALENTYSFKRTSSIPIKIDNLVYKFKLELIGLQDEYAEMINLYKNDGDLDSDSDSDSEYDLDSEEIDSLKSKIAKLQSLLEKPSLLSDIAEQECYDDDKNDFLKSLKNNFVLETTPLGNIIMVYNFDKQGFSYYSDKSIGNQYLEVVCRKYVIQFQCKPLLENYKFINEGKLSNFQILKNEVKNINKKNAKMSFADFKKQIV